MPLLKIQDVESNCAWAVWRIQETVVELEALVDFTLETDEYLQVSNEVKRKEWLAGKLLLKKLSSHFGLDYKGIFKDANGKPFLNESKVHISVSHSNEYVACIAHKDHCVGIDVEPLKSKILKIKQKFLSEEELAWAGNSLEILTMAWCAKESLYKMIGLKGVIFGKDLKLKPFVKEANTISAEIVFGSIKASTSLRVEKLGDYTLVYCY